MISGSEVTMHPLEWALIALSHSLQVLWLAMLLVSQNWLGAALLMAGMAYSCSSTVRLYEKYGRTKPSAE
jgi:hypothetical protein